MTTHSCPMALDVYFQRHNAEKTLTLFIQRSCSPCLAAAIRSLAKVAACEITRICTIKGVREPMRHIDYMVSEYSRTGRFRVPRFLREIITTFWDRVCDVTDIIRRGSINSFHECDRTFQLGYFFCSHTPSPESNTDCIYLYNWYNIQIYSFFLQN